MFELLRGTMAALARRRLTVLVVEDLHWLDRTTRDALLYLAAMVREGRWALVVTYREDELAARPDGREVLESLQRDALVRVTLDALSPTDVAAQMAAILGAAVLPRRAELMYRRTGGIPLLVEEVLAAEAAGTGGVPHHLRGLFLARVKWLGTPAVRVVEVVAVLGDRCSDRLIAEILGADRTAVLAALDRAAAADVLVAERSGASGPYRRDPPDRLESARYRRRRHRPAAHRALTDVVPPQRGAPRPLPGLLPRRAIPSPGGRWLADDGWVRHPVGVPSVWDLHRWLDDKVWESENGPSLRQLCLRAYHWNTPMCWIDENLLAISGIGGDDEAMLAGVRIFDVTTGVEVSTFAGPTGALFADPHRLYAAAPGGLQIWDPATGERTGAVPGFLPTSRHPGTGELATIGDHTLHRWTPPH